MTCKKVKCCSIPNKVKDIAEQLGVEQCFIPINEKENVNKVINLNVTEECLKKFAKYCKQGETVELVMAFYLESLDV